MIKTFLDGNAYCATFEDFVNLMESPAGFGNTPEDAIEALLKDTMKRAQSILEDIKPEQEYADGLISRVREHVLESQTGFECEFVEVSYRHGAVKTSWDSKKLDAYAKEHPDILDFKKVSTSKDTTALKWL